MSKVRLIDICKPKQWKTIPSSQLTKEGYPVYGANGKIGFYSAYNHEKETILITCRGATCGSLNISEPFSYVNGNAMCLDNLDDCVSLKYLYYNLCGYNFAKVISGTAQPQITGEGLSKVVIKLHSLVEQKKIVALFDKLDNNLNCLNLYSKKLDELIKSRFVEMFGDPITNSHKLPIKTLSELGELGRGVSKHRPRNAPELLGGVYPLIQTGDVANASLYIIEYNSTYSEIGYKQSKMWNKGTLCITIAANIAKTAILTFDSCFPDSVVGFNSNESTNNIFIHFWFSFFQELLEEQAPESAQKNINLKILSELKVIVPPIELQNQFATFVEQTNKSKLAVKQVLEKAEMLKKALMQEYFG